MKVRTFSQLFLYMVQHIVELAFPETIVQKAARISLTYNESFSVNYK